MSRVPPRGPEGGSQEPGTAEEGRPGVSLRAPASWGHAPLSLRFPASSSAGVTLLPTTYGGPSAASGLFLEAGKYKAKPAARRSLWDRNRVSQWLELPAHVVFA